MGKAICNRLFNNADEMQPADWKNIMAGPKTDLQAWLGSLGSFLATETHGDLTDAERPIIF